MAHFAEIRSDNNIVLRVIVVGNNQEQQYGGFNTPELEQWVASFHPNDPVIKAELGGIYPQTYWKQTSYNTRSGKYYNSNGEIATDQSKAFRKNYGSIGFTYSEEYDGFIQPRPPHASWTLNTTTGVWLPPVTIEVPSVYTDESDVQKDIFVIWDETNLRWTGKKNRTNESIDFIYNPSTKTWTSV
jgi:hypothetical protein